MSVPPPAAHGAADAREEHLARCLHHLGRLLPDQGPLDVFVHQNTLHAFQHLPFHDAVVAASEQFGTEPYLPESRFRAFYAEGRITETDLRAALAASPRVDVVLRGGLDEDALDLLLLRHEITTEHPARWRWLVDERAALRRLRPDVPASVRAGFLDRSARALTDLARRASDLAAVTATLGGRFDPSSSVTDLASLRRVIAREPEAAAVGALWAACANTVTDRAQPLRRRPGFYRDLLKELTAEDPAELAHPVIIRYTAAYLDRGVADWHMPGRHLGLFHAWRALALAPFAPEPPWLDGIEVFLRARDTPTRVILDLLDLLHIPQDAWEPFLTRVALELPGWAGMIHRLERRPGDRGPGAPPASLLDFLAMRFTYDYFAWRDVARRRLRFDGPLATLSAHVDALPLHPHDAAPRIDAPWRMFQIAQLAGLTALDVAALSPEARAAILAREDRFHSVARRRVWLEAYERRYRQRVLRGLADNRARPPAMRTPSTAKLQVFTCFDNREEVFRRHLEDASIGVETFGVPGFFGLPIEYQPLGAPRALPYCPVTASPLATIVERGDTAAHVDRRLRWQRRLARVLHRVDESSRSLIRGAVVTALLGLPAGLLWWAESVAPRRVASLRARALRRALPEVPTAVDAVRPDDAPATTPGIALDDAVRLVADLFENVGLTTRFAPLALVLGHGSDARNNPHLAAYQCGACSGRRGGHNARVFALLANRSDVRAALRTRGIAIPDGTHFVAGEHNTATDTVTYDDVDAVPPSLRAAFDEARAAVDTALRETARERCRMFEAAPRDPSAHEALRHVLTRAVDPSQARPELGTATVACGVVGRRSLTRGLFLDRRCFVISYDPTGDADGSVLARVLSVAAPVGANINLAYLFSTVDNDRLGAGSKLPHNPVGLLGVMDGSFSDLRTGLPRQTIEIHEAMRLLLVVEATPARLLEVADRQPAVRELVVNGWVQLVSLDPDTGAMQRFTAGGFAPWTPDEEPPTPTTPAWRDWYAGTMDFVPPAVKADAGALR